MAIMREQEHEAAKERVTRVPSKYKSTSGIRRDQPYANMGLDVSNRCSFQIWKVFCQNLYFNGTRAHIGVARYELLLSIILGHTPH